MTQETKNTEYKTKHRKESKTQETAPYYSEGLEPSNILAISAHEKQNSCLPDLIS